METIGRIRRKHFIKGKTIREIARDLKVSRNTVFDDLLSSNAAKSAREQLTLIGSSRNFAGAVTRAATTLCAVTPGDGPSSMGKRRLPPMSH